MNSKVATLLFFLWLSAVCFDGVEARQCRCGMKTCSRPGSNIRNDGSRVSNVLWLLTEEGQKCLITQCRWSLQGCGNREYCKCEEHRANGRGECGWGTCVRDHCGAWC